MAFFLASISKEEVVIFLILLFEMWFENITADKNVHAFNLEYWNLQSFNWAKTRVGSV